MMEGGICPELFQMSLGPPSPVTSKLYIVHNMKGRPGLLFLSCSQMQARAGRHVGTGPHYDFGGPCACSLQWTSGSFMCGVVSRYNLRVQSSRSPFHKFKITAAVPTSLVDSESDPFSLCMRKTGKRYSSRTQVKGSVWQTSPSSSQLFDKIISITNAGESGQVLGTYCSVEPVALGNWKTSE